MTRKIEEHRNVRSHQDLDRETVDGIHETVKSAFGDPNFSRDETKAHIGGDVVHVVKDGDRVVGFSSTQFGSPRELLHDPQLPDGRVAYFAAAAVHADAQGTGAYRDMTEERVSVADREKVDIVTRTQNERVENSITGALERRKARGEIQGYNVTRHHQVGIYGRQLAKQTNEEAQVDSKIGEAYSPQSGFDKQRGDAHVLIFRIRRR